MPLPCAGGQRQGAEERQKGGGGLLERRHSSRRMWTGLWRSLGVLRRGKAPRRHGSRRKWPGKKDGEAIAEEHAGVFFGAARPGQCGAPQTGTPAQSKP